MFKSKSNPPTYSLRYLLALCYLFTFKPACFNMLFKVSGGTSALSRWYAIVTIPDLFHVHMPGDSLLPY